MKKLFISGLVIFVVCFSLACISWFTFEQQDNKTNKIHKTFNKHEFSHLNISSKVATVNIKQGQHFTVSYKGAKDITTNRSEGRLKVKEINNNEDHYGLNFNPFKKNNSEINITVPKSQQKDLNMKLNSKRININNLKLNKVNIKTTYYNGIGLKAKNSQFENLKYQSEVSPVNLNSCLIKHSDIKTNSNINIKNSLLNNTILLSKDSDIKLSQMKSTSDIKASASKGDIHMSYATKPKNTLLKLNPVNGKSHVDNKYFKNGKIGNSHNILEFYTNNGDIYIK